METKYLLMVGDAAGNVRDELPVLEAESLRDARAHALGFLDTLPMGCGYRVWIVAVPSWLVVEEHAKPDAIVAPRTEN